MQISKSTIYINERDGPGSDRTSAKLVIPAHNMALGALPPAELSRVIAPASAVRVDAGDVIYENGNEIDHIYFPIDAIVSAVSILEDGSTVEISMTGREGIVGLSALIGGGRAMHWTRVSVGGDVLRVSTVSLRQLFQSSHAVSDMILRSYRSLFTQICQRSVCNVRHSLLQRLCVWLLMTRDRVGADELPFTQEDIASRISVRRAGVSVAASTLQSMQAISYRRGKIVIKNRHAIEVNACECYGVLGQDFAGG